MKSELSGIFTTRDAEEWFALLHDKDCCVTPIRTLDEAFDSDLFREKHVGMRPMLSRTPALNEFAPAPQLGEHSIEVLKGLGVQGMSSNI